MLNLKSLAIVFSTTTLLGMAGFSSALHAEDATVKEKINEATHDTKRATKKTARKVKDEVCEMVNGKMKCVGKKIKHAAQNTGDAIEDAVD
ncbi:MAG: hypothetical protein K2Q18_13205 [Bdellovibrionales bacterium]|nr:hypothetical protein [Bdellovibrionales bacterium]